MGLLETSCFRVSDIKNCKFCQSTSIVKNGTTKNKKQQYKCKKCKKHFISHYTYKAYHYKVNEIIVNLLKRGVGIRDIAGAIEISTTTVLRRIVLIARKINKPPILPNRIYEVDEMRCYLRKKTKPIWIVYALDRESKEVINFSIGSRTKQTLSYVTNSVILSKPKKVYTDKLIHYKSLFSSSDITHKVTRFGTNRIERKNLSLRTHLKRLNRKTICFSRSFIILMCVLKIYFWR